MMPKNGKTDLAIIPGGLTLLLQPLDVCINLPFKAALKEMYTNWMADGKYEYMTTSKIKWQGIDLLCMWLKDMWEHISPILIEKSFKKCGISNSLDVPEDDFIWYSDDDCVSSAGADDDDGESNGE
jgi:hypothetical protein